MKHLLIAASLLTPLPALAEESAERLPGHRAVYELSLAPRAEAQDVLGASGRYVFELEDVCEGYTLNERLVVRLDRTSDRILTDYRLSAYESAEGDLYRFSTETSFNGTSGQASEGTLMAEESLTQVDFEAADDLQFEERVLPPLAHVRAVLSAARSGKDRHAATVFDGDVSEPVFEAITRIAPHESGDSNFAVLDGIEGWALDSVYYAPSAGNETPVKLPQFRFSGVIHDNGVVSDLTLIYEDFSLRADLKELDIFDSGC